MGDAFVGTYAVAVRAMYDSDTLMACNYLVERVGAGPYVSLAARDAEAVECSIRVPSISTAPGAEPDAAALERAGLEVAPFDAEAAARAVGAPGEFEELLPSAGASRRHIPLRSAAEVARVRVRRGLSAEQVARAIRRGARIPLDEASIRAASEVLVGLA